MMKHATGEFDVKSTPYPPETVTAGLDVGRMAFHKTFRGDLSGTSVLEMLGHMDRALSSGGYVALERITGTLDGRSGSFLMQHSSTMSRGQQAQAIAVVPDSGKDGLEGIEGTLTIDIVEKKHLYTFDYSFTASR